MYLSEIMNVGLLYPRGWEFNLHAYSDTDYAGCKLDHKSTSDTCQIFAGCLIFRSSRKQEIVALFIAEVEYITAGSYCSQVL